MKSKDDIAEIILEAFRKRNSKTGHIIMMRVFRFSILPALNPKEQALFPKAVDDLIGKGFILYEQTNPECLRLTEKGYDYIYPENTTSTSKERLASIKNEQKMNNPLKILNAAISRVPFVKYALGIAGIAAAIAIIKSFGIENHNTIPIISILVMLGFMVLLFLFASLTTVRDRPLKIAGYILVFTTVTITCVSAILLTTSVFILWPKPITEYGIFSKDKPDTSKVVANVDSSSIKRKNQGERHQVARSVSSPAPHADVSSCFPYASQADLSASQSTHDAAYFAQNENTSVENIFWKATITKEFNNELDCIYAESHGISLRLNMLNGNDINCAKALRTGMQVFIWGTTKEERRSPIYIDINIYRLKIIR